MADVPPEPMIVAAAALVRGDGRVLVQRRPAGATLAGLWEFPGGKLEPGESAEAALVRELAEELDIRVGTAACLPVAASDGEAGGRPLRLLLYLVRAWEGEPRPHAAAALRWVTVTELATLPMPPADVPLVAALARALA